jgi:hypothetical protein
MMMFNILYIAYSNLFFTDIPLSKYVIKMGLDKNVIGGYDGRHNSSSDYDHEVIQRIKKHNYRMSLLKYLENPQNSISDKMKVLETGDIEEFQDKIAPDIKSGGLLNDWDFEF